MKQKGDPEKRNICNKIKSQNYSLVYLLHTGISLYPIHHGGWGKKTSGNLTDFQALDPKVFGIIIRVLMCNLRP